ncbi:MAG TPA: hypothetical protein VH950_04365 [Gaiellaceae bacterium]|jgi:hypothetical protein
MPLGISSRAVLTAFRDARSEAERPARLLVSGPLAEQLARELAEGGVPDTVRLGGEVEGADAVVLVLAGEAAAPEVELARSANRAAVPVIGVQLDPAVNPDIPYVLATDVVPCPRGEGFPIDAIAGVLARRLGEQAAGLAAALPRLHDGVSRGLTRRAAHRNALLALLPLSRDAHLPVMTITQVRLALSLSVANGREVGSATAPDVGAVLAAAPALRALSRRVVLRAPMARRLVQAGVAYGATLAVGKASSLRATRD